MLLQGDARRDPWESPRVRIESPAGGEAIEGELKVPRELAYAEPHTNAALDRDRFIMAHLDRWLRHRHKRDGLVPIPGTLQMSEPYELPRGIPVETPAHANFNDDEAERAEMVAIRCTYLARRERPMYITTDDFWQRVADAERYGVDLETQEASRSFNEVPADQNGKDYIEVEGGEDHLKLAEERRQRMGVTRQEFLIGALEEPF